MSFNFVTPKDFFRLLYKERDFCEAVGRVMLAAGMLETNLRLFLLNKQIPVRANATLGNMVEILNKQGLLSKNGLMLFKDLGMKRNYLAHSIFDLFAEVMPATILEREGLVAEDVSLFIERANNLVEDFLHFSKLVEGADIQRPVLF